MQAAALALRPRQVGAVSAVISVIGMIGMEIRERLLSRDEATRTLSYSVVDGVPLESHTATISVEPDGDGSKVTWAYDVEPAEMAPIFGDTYKGALAAVEASFS